MFGYKSIFKPVAYSDGVLCAINPQDFQDNSRNGTFIRQGVATRINADGDIEIMAQNVPRLDYRNAGCPELLIEDASTNYYEQTDISGNTVGSEMTATPTTLLGYPAVTLEMDAGVAGQPILSNSRRINLPDMSFQHLSNNYIVSSFLFSPDTSNKLSTWLFSSVGYVAVTININGTLEVDNNTLNATEIQAGAKKIQNGIYRLWFSFKTPFDATFTRADLAPATAGGIATVGMPQVELGTEPTSPIITTGTPATRQSETAIFPVPSGTTEIKRNGVIESNIPSNYLVPFGRTSQITMK